MRIEKDSVRYGGKSYPAISIYLSEEEQEKLFVSEYHLFADSSLAGAILNKDGDPKGAKELDIDLDVDFYDGVCSKFCGGSITEDEAKKQIGNIIKNW